MLQFGKRDAARLRQGLCQRIADARRVEESMQVASQHIAALAAVGHVAVLLVQAYRSGAAARGGAHVDFVSFQVKLRKRCEYAFQVQAFARDAGAALFGGEGGFHGEQPQAFGVAAFFHAVRVVQLLA